MPAFHIVVLNKLAPKHLDMIEAAAPGSTVVSCSLEAALPEMDKADILLAWGFNDIRPLFLSSSRLRWVHSLSAGVEKLIFAEMRRNDCLLTNSRGIHGIPVSEHVLAMMLAFSRGLPTCAKQQQAHLWRRVPSDEIHNKTIGILGLGSIGREIAKKAKAFGMNVLAMKREQTSELFVDRLYKPHELPELLQQCDFVVVSLPLTEETQHLLTLEHFRAMKPSAYFINIARGEVLVEADLITALQEGLIRGAGLDVFAEEPLPAASPLWDLPNVIITPHTAALSPYYLDRAIKLFADNLTRLIHDREMFNIVDKTKGY